MGLPVLENYIMGGVDSRSNCLNMPRERALLCKNWVPDEAGFLRLRHGYTEVEIDSAVGAAIHSVVHYKTLSGAGKYILIGYGSSLKKYDLAAHTTSTPTVKGVALSGSGWWAWAKANNSIYGVNGTVSKWFDGTTLRDIGLRALTSSDVVNVIVSEGVREPSSAERSAVSLTPAAGGSFAATTLSGRLVYVVYFDTSVNERGPVASYSGAGRVALTLNQKIGITGLANLSSTDADWVKLLAITEDGGSNAYFCTETSTNITNITRASSTATVTATSHGLSVGDVVIIAGNSESVYNEVWKVDTVPDVNTVTFALHSASGATGTGGTIKRIRKVANATTTGEILTSTVDTSILANEDRGIPASTVTSGTSVTGGFQLYASIFNSTAGQHVGNRIKIGARLAPTTRCNVRMTGLPNLSGEDAEWVLLIGRTGDAGEVPYVVTDLAGNFRSVTSGTTSDTITEPLADGNYELPTRNTTPPAMNKLIRVGDRFFGNEDGSATIRWSESETDYNTGIFLGDPFQSWAENNLETMPTGDALSCLAEYEYEAWCFSLSDVAVLTDAAGYLTWRGPWNVGCAGKRAFTKTPYGPFWISGEKQLITVMNGAPYPASSEYEAALLSQIGDAYLGETEVEYIRDVTAGVDHVIIKGRKSNGDPFHVIHDFKLKDERSPDGQGYETQYVGALASNYVIEQVRDSNDKLRIFAGAADGKLYQLYDGANDGGVEYDADYISLINAGPERTAFPIIQWHGDRLVSMSIAKSLKASTDGSTGYSFDSIVESGSAASAGGPIGEQNFHYEAKLRAPEVTRVYLRIQLTSHSADGNLDLNAIPHVPVEDYGRVYVLMPEVGKARGAR